jgi:hypothetical protein
MKARKGFIATSFAVLFALLLGMTAMYAIGLGVQTSKEEARMIEEMQYSLYPIAWSTTNFVLESLRDAYNDQSDLDSQKIAKIFLSGDFTTSPFSIDVTFTVPVGAGSVSCNVKVEGRSGAPRVKTRAFTDRYSSVEVQGFLSPDHLGVYPDTWSIVWR